MDACGKLQRTTRLTRSAGGIRESVASHSLSIAGMVLSVSKSIFFGCPDFNVALALELAIIHDMPEAVCGDTPTLHKLSPKERLDKVYAEHKGARVISTMIGGDWMYSSWSNYENNHISGIEGSVVNILDKMAPTICHLQSGYGVLLDEGITPYRFREIHEGHLMRGLAEVSAALECGVWSYERGLRKSLDDLFFKVAWVFHNAEKEYSEIYNRMNER